MKNTNKFRFCHSKKKKIKKILLLYIIDNSLNLKNKVTNKNNKFIINEEPSL